MEKHLTLLDDSEFYIQRSCNSDTPASTGFLLRRCEALSHARGIRVRGRIRTLPVRRVARFHYRAVR